MIHHHDKLNYFQYKLERCLFPVGGGLWVYKPITGGGGGLISKEIYKLQFETL